MRSFWWLTWMGLPVLQRMAVRLCILKNFSKGLFDLCCIFLHDRLFGTKPHLKDYGKQLSGVWESWQALVELPVDCKLGMYSLGWLELSEQVAIMDWGDRHRSTDEGDNAWTECTDGGYVSEGTAGLVAKCEAGSVSEVTCWPVLWKILLVLWKVLQVLFEVYILRWQ